MIAWVLYTVLVSVLIALAAHAMESIVRSLGYPKRWVWVGAALLIVGLVATAPSRVTVRPALPVLSEVPVSVVAGRPIEHSWTSILTSFVNDARRRVTEPVIALVRRADGALPARTGILAIGFWATVSFAIAAILLMVQLRFVRARRRWPVGVVQGVNVRIAPNVGPVVIGVARPEIVVPRWLLGRNAEEQRLVIAHEAEHVRARDTLVLAGGCVLVALMPWNPVAWYLASRLRLAVELDCDARVLRAGAAPHSYGSLLIDVAERNAGLRFGVPALADDSSHLHQRLLAMKLERPNYFLARASAAATVGFVAVLAACAAEMPTAADIDEMDVAKAEKAATHLAMLKENGVVEYVVDGHKMAASEAAKIDAADIAKIDVVKHNGHGTISITTKGHPSELRVATTASDVQAAAGAAREVAVVGYAKDSMATVKIRSRTPMLSEQPADQPLFIIDGVKQTNVDIKQLDRTNIQSVSVVKGSSVAQYTNDPSVRGVIIITTKKGNP